VRTSSGRAGGTGGERPLVLLVDDDVEILATFRRSLRAEPFDLVLATHPAEAFRILLERRIAVLVADEGMPGMAGTELLERAQQESPETVRLILTGHASLDVAQRAINAARVFRFLTKPLRADALAAHIRDAIAEHELRCRHGDDAPRAEREAAARRALESRYRGLTRVERDPSGAVVVPEADADLEAALREAERAARDRGGGE